MNVAFGSISPAIGAMIVRTRRRIVEHFLEENALSASSAVLFKAESPIEKRLFKRMLARGVIRAAGQGRYWIDTNQHRIDGEARRMRLTIIAAAVGVGILAALLLLFLG